MEGNERMKEVYKDPTAQRAIGNVTKIEKLRKRHRIREGDVVRMNVEMQQELPNKKTFTKKSRCPYKRNTHTLRHGRSSERTSGKFSMVGV